MARKRKIEGKTYYYMQRVKSKTEFVKLKLKYRKNWDLRLVKTKNGYAVYGRPK